MNANHSQQTVVTAPQPVKKISPRQIGTPSTHPSLGEKGVRGTEGFT